MYGKKKKYYLIKFIAILTLCYCLYYTSNDWYKYVKHEYAKTDKNYVDSTLIKDSVIVCNEELFKFKYDSLLLVVDKQALFNAKLDSVLKYQKINHIKLDTISK